MPLRSARAGSKGAALAVLATTRLVIALDYSLVNATCPTPAGLHCSGGTVQWVISAYTLTFGGFLLLSGRAANLPGRRRTVMAARPPCSRRPPLREGSPNTPAC